MLAAADPDRQLDDVRDEVSWLITKAAGYRQTRGEPQAVLLLFQRVHSARRARLADDDPDTLGAAHDVGRALHALGSTGGPAT